MRKVYFVILLSLSLLLSACNEAVVQHSNQKVDKEIRYAKLLTKEELNEQKEANLEKNDEQDKEGNKEIIKKEKKSSDQGNLDEITKLV